MFRPHLMQGWSPDFIPKLTQDAIDAHWIDRVVPVNGADATRLARELACKEGLFVGISAGATLAGALQVAAEAPAGANLLCMLPDTGERYLSTPLFEGIGVDMTDDELAISRSTPGARFDTQAPPPTPATEPSPVPAVEPEVAAFVEALLADATQPLVLFALEWCEFCWSLRKLFAQLGVPYRAIDLDSAEYQQHDRGGQIRAVLAARTGQRTIPQVFVGGSWIGGCSETFELAKDGRLQAMLKAHGAACDEHARIEPAALLPAWLQSRGSVMR
jgi:cysteine synthase A